MPQTKKENFANINHKLTTPSPGDYSNFSVKPQLGHLG